MQNFIFITLAIVSTVFQVASSQATTPDNKKGWQGKLSSLDAGLGGTVVVTETDTLVINNYALEDASAPALYWWGSTSTNLAGGFRISNKQVNEAATTDTYTIKLDAGKTTADFMTVGLWCEKFSANFGQATLAPPTGTGSDPNATTPTGGNAQQTMKPNSGPANAVGWLTLGVSTFLVVFSSV